MPRLFRESPLNSIWEGSGNVAALDVLRALAREPEVVEAFFGRGRPPRPAPTPGSTPPSPQLQAELADLDDVELRARRVVERLALVLQGSLLVRHGHPAVADAFCASRLGGDWGRRSARCPAASTSPRSSPAPYPRWADRRRRGRTGPRLRARAPLAAVDPPADVASPTLRRSEIVRRSSVPLVSLPADSVST